MIFKIFGDEEFKFVSNRISAPQNLISAITSRKILRKGCHGYLVVARDTSVERTSVSNVPIACEFPYVFPNELPGLQNHSEIELCIDVVPSTMPISMPPYRMAPAELKELKEQLQDLIDKGFIKPSVSP